MLRVSLNRVSLIEGLKKVDFEYIICQKRKEVIKSKEKYNNNKNNDDDDDDDDDDNNNKTNRHDMVRMFLDWNIPKNYEIAVFVEWYKHETKDITNGNKVTISCKFPIQTDRKIDANKPNIVVKGFKEGTCLLIDMTCPQDSNFSRKEFEKLAT